MSSGTGLEMTPGQTAGNNNTVSAINRGFRAQQWTQSVNSFCPSAAFDHDRTADVLEFDHKDHCAAVMHALNAQKGLGHFCDVALVVQGQHLWAHKAILAANSPFFVSTLKQSSLDTNGLFDMMPLPTNNVLAAQAVIEYMYTGRMVVAMETVAELVSLTEKLAMERAKDACAAHLEAFLNNESCWTVCNIARMNSMDALLQAAHKYVLQNRSQLLQNLSVREACVEDLQYLLSCHDTSNRTAKCDELYKLHTIFKWVLFRWSERVICYEELLQKYVDTDSLDRCDIIQLFSNKEYQEFDFLNHRATRALMESTLPAEAPDHCRLPVICSENGQATEVTNHETDDNANSDNEIHDTFIYSGNFCESLKPGEHDNGERFEEFSKSRKRKMNVPVKIENVRAPDNCTNPRQNDQRPIQHDPRLQEQKHLNDNEPQIQKNPHFIKTVKPSIMNTSAVKRKRLDINQAEYSVGNEQESNEMPSYSSSLSTFTSGTGPGPALPVACPPNMSSPHKSDLPTGILDSPTPHPSVSMALGSAVASSLQNFAFPWANSAPSLLEPSENSMSSDDRLCRFTCITCGQVFVSRHSLFTHRAKEHGHGDCDSGVKRRRTHYIMQGAECVCSICHRAYPTYAKLAAHVKIHEKTMKCPNCEFWTYRKDKLTDHIDKVHRHIKAHICKHCCKAFSSRKHLLRHARVHTDIRPFQCRACNFLATRKDKLRHHVQRHHPLWADLLTDVWPGKTLILRPKEIKLPNEIFPQIHNDPDFPGYKVVYLP